jgi:hypothetical protein
MSDDAFAQEDRRVEFLGHALYAAGDVHGVANDRDLSFSGMTDPAQGDRSKMNSDADAWPHIEIAFEDRREPRCGVLHPDRRTHRVPAGDIRRFAPHPEDRENAVPDVLVDKAIVVEDDVGSRSVHSGNTRRRKAGSSRSGS